MCFNQEGLFVEYNIARMKMTRIETVMFLLLGVSCFIHISSSAPVSDANNNVVDEILMRLKQLKQQSEGKKMKKFVEVYKDIIV